MSKERPILFSGPMVRAILEGRKTQTRRVVKQQPTGKQRIVEGVAHTTIGMDPADDGAVWYVADCVNPGIEIRCPYGGPSDALWVRETWFDNGSDWNGCADKTPARCVFRADGEFSDHFAEDYMHAKWSPSIHMPRWASRITLEVKAVWVERLQQISEADALAEGIIKEQVPDDLGHCSDDDIGYKVTESQNGWHLFATAAFHSLWNSINGPESWDANPWVWVVEFERVPNATNPA